MMRKEEGKEEEEEEGEMSKEMPRKEEDLSQGNYDHKENL